MNFNLGTTKGTIILGHLNYLKKIMILKISINFLLENLKIVLLKLAIIHLFLRI